MVCNHEVRGSIPLSSTGSPKPGVFVTVLRYVSGTASTGRAWRLWRQVQGFDPSQLHEAVRILTSDIPVRIHVL